MAGFDCLAPGAMFLRDADEKYGLVISVKRPHWDYDKKQAMGWSFELLIDNVLVYTTLWPMGCRLVQLDG